MAIDVGSLLQTACDTDAGASHPGHACGVVVGGLVMTEIVAIERQSGGVWAEIVAEVPATFEELRLDERVALATWTHKPLMRVWLLPATDLRDGDRIVRGSGACWYVRGTPLVGPGRTHVAALTEGAAEDNLFVERTTGTE